jgi:hypothetical protein
MVAALRMRARVASASRLRGAAMTLGDETDALKR